MAYQHIHQGHICNGLAAYTSGAYLHSLSCELDLENSKQSKVYHRAEDCELIIIPENSVCDVCMKHQKNIEKSNSIMQKNINKPAHLDAPLSNTHPNRVKLALKEGRVKSSKLLAEIERMKKEIKTNGINLDQDLSNDICHHLCNYFENSRNTFFKVGSNVIIQ